MARTGCVSLAVARAPDAVFAAITDIDALASWNDRIDALASGPGRLEVGDEWVVDMRVLGKRFPSRSIVLELDRTARRFVHRSRRDDGNPSFTVWTWEVTPADGHARVTVQWDLQPRTPSRRLAAAIRGRMIPKEAAASIRQLESRC